MMFHFEFFGCCSLFFAFDLPLFKPYVHWWSKLIYEDYFFFKNIFYAFLYTCIIDLWKITAKNILEIFVQTEVILYTFRFNIKISLTKSMDVTRKMYFISYKNKSIEILLLLYCSTKVTLIIQHLWIHV